jgi:hypothetical protein
MGIRRDGRHAIALTHAELGESRCPPITALMELRVRQPKLAVDYREAPAVQLAGAAHEVERSQGSFHAQASLPA